jgi:predicted lipoprotein with Yx(FWY)xxD motif
MRTFIKWAGQYRTLALLSIGVTLTVAACKKDNNNNATPPVVTGVQLSANAQLGKILTDSAGNTLYFFTIDADGSSGCTGGCLTAWPIFHTSSTKLGDGLDSKDFATIVRSDGKSQTTYKGWPLYYFQNDTKAGDVKGDKVGNIWYVAKPDYTVMLANKQLVGKDGIQYDSLFQPKVGITQYITDDRGRTLYAFSPDKFKKNTFTKADLSNNPVWPMNEVAGVSKIPSLLDKTAFDTVMLFGKIQLSYKGWPLYYFGADSLKRGNTKGVSVPTPGFWPYVNAGTLVAPQP